MSKAITAIIVIVILALAGYGIYYYATTPRTPQEEETATTTPAMLDAPNVANATYTIEEAPITLVNGRAEVKTTPGSETKQLTMIFGEAVVGDLNNDGNLDAALVLTNEPGGSGTFYYIAAALVQANGTTTATIGTNGLLLGDKISPQSINIEDGVIVMNYADRAQGEPMTKEPSVGITKYFKLEGGMLVEFTPTPAEETPAPEEAP